MNSIEISIENINNITNIKIDIINKKININNQEKEISEEKIESLLRIIRTWENNYQSNNLIDAESFEIKINTINETEIIKGKGSYPNDYQLLKEWIGEFDVR